MKKSLAKNYLYAILGVLALEPLYLCFFIWNELWKNNVFILFNFICCVTILVYALIMLPKLFNHKKDFIIIGLIWFIVTNLYPICFCYTINKSFGDFISTYTSLQNIYGAIHYCSFLFPAITPLLVKIFPKLKKQTIQ